MTGSLDRSQVPGDFWETNDPTHDTKCWSPGTSKPGLFTTICLFCKSVRQKNTDGTYNYNHQKDNLYCNDDFINSSSSNKFDNCKVGLDSKDNTCVSCASGYSRNLNFFWHAKYS